MTEDYVSYEVAKLLKEKGFNEPIFEFYDKNGTVLYSRHPQGLKLSDFCKDDELYPHITHQMAAKWLREIHGIGIFPGTYTLTNASGTEEYHPYGSAIVNLKTYELMTNDIMSETLYEDAFEHALTYVLKELV